MQAGEQISPTHLSSGGWGKLLPTPPPRQLPHQGTQKVTFSLQELPFGLQAFIYSFSSANPNMHYF